MPDIFEEAAATGATPSAEAEAAASTAAPPVEPSDAPAFDPVKFTNPETGQPYTFRDKTIYDPEKGGNVPRMLPDGSPDLTVDGFLRKTNSGANRGIIRRIVDTVRPPKADGVEETERIVEAAAQQAAADEKKIEAEAIRQQQIDANTSARALVEIIDSGARMVGGGSATADKTEKEFLQGAVYRYEKETGRKMPVPPELELFGAFSSVYGAKLERPEVRKTIKGRFGFIKKAPMLGKMIPMMKRQPAQPVADDPTAPQDAAHPSFKREEGE